jgi:hypothetical protein
MIHFFEKTLSSDLAADDGGTRSAGLVHLSTMTKEAGGPFKPSLGLSGDVRMSQTRSD